MHTIQELDITYILNLKILNRLICPLRQVDCRSGLKNKQFMKNLYKWFFAPALFPFEWIWNY
jgi:hypothetical protein